MALVQIPLVVQSPATGAAISGATVAVVVHGGGAAVIYTAADGSSRLAGNTYTSDSGGRATSSSNPLWLAQGTYDFTVSGGSLTAFTVVREMLSAAASDMVALAGEIKMWAGASAPTGFLLCQGQEVQRSDYPTLFANIGTVYGAGNGTTTFNLPNLQDRYPQGKSGSTSLGAVGGSATHTHSISSDGAHTHTVASHTHTTPVHLHTLSGNGGAMLSDNSANASQFAYLLGPDSGYGPGFAPTRGRGYFGSGAYTVSAAGGPNAAGVGLYGHTDDSSAGVSGAATPGTDSTGAHTHGGATGSQNALPPFQIINYIIRHGKLV